MGMRTKLGKRKPTLMGRFEVEVDGSIGDGGGGGGGEGGRAMNPTVKEFELVDASRGKRRVGSMGVVLCRCSAKLCLAERSLRFGPPLTRTPDCL